MPVILVRFVAENYDICKRLVCVEVFPKSLTSQQLCRQVMSNGIEGANWGEHPILLMYMMVEMVGSFITNAPPVQGCGAISPPPE